MDALIHGGDLFFRSKIPEQLANLVYEPLLKVAANGIPVLLVPGNHERSRLPENLFLNHENIHVFREPTTVVLEIGGYQIAFGGFPFVRRTAGYSFNDVVERTGLLSTRADLKILCMHQAVHGARVGPVGFMFRKGADVIGLDQFPTDLDLIISGHIHRYQVLRTDHGQLLIYPGSIERTSFAEQDEPKGYCILHVDDIDLNQQEVEFVQLPTRPMTQVRVPDHLHSAKETLDYIAQILRFLDEDSIVRLIPNQTSGSQGLTTEQLRAMAPDRMNVEIRPPRRIVTGKT